MCSGSKRDQYNDSGSDEFDELADGGSAVDFILEANGLLVIGNADPRDVADIIDAETRRAGAQAELEQVRFQTMELQFEREDIRFERVQQAMNDLKQAMERNPFSSLLDDLLGSSNDSSGSFGGFPGFDGRTSAD